MPTFIGHSAVGLAISSPFFGRKHYASILVLTLIASFLPDLDVIGYRLGIPYGHLLGHRGLSHSIFGAVLTGILFTLPFLKWMKTRRWTLLLLFLNFFLANLSHTLLDAMTSGGLGVAFYSPFSNERYFLPWRGIRVSALSIRRFFDYNGMAVLRSEFRYVILPALMFTGMVILIKLWYRKKRG